MCRNIVPPKSVRPLVLGVASFLACFQPSLCSTLPAVPCVFNAVLAKTKEKQKEHIPGKNGGITQPFSLSNQQRKGALKRTQVKPDASPAFYSIRFSAACWGARAATRTSPTDSTDPSASMQIWKPLLHKVPFPFSSGDVSDP